MAQLWEKNLSASPPCRGGCGTGGDPVGWPYREAVSAQRVTLDLWAAGKITVVELRDRFRAHAAAILAADPL